MAVNKTHVAVAEAVEKSTQSTFWKNLRNVHDVGNPRPT